MRGSRAYAVGPAILAVLAFEIAIFQGFGRAQTQPLTPFARQILELSESGGTFDTDNLISNERSYLHVLPALKEMQVRGGVYIGVGPDQNFSYIAAVRPTSAFLIDVRRDNLLLHLLFKALFQLSDSRAEYLGRLFGRRLPGPPDPWRTATLDRLVSQLDLTQVRPDDARLIRKQVDGQIATFGLALSAADFATIERFHKTFIDAGLSLKFQSWGRAPRAYYPTYRELLLETDRSKHRGNFLESEDDYQFVRGLQLRDAIVPVVGDLSGTTALAAIGRLMKRRGDELSAFYVSNVELYLFQNGVFPRFAENLAAIPHNARSVMIRSVFAGPGFWSIPDTPSGYASASLVQTVRSFQSKRYRTYDELIVDSR
jgi:hypothetical protein